MDTTCDASSASSASSFNGQAYLARVPTYTITEDAEGELVFDPQYGTRELRVALECAFVGLRTHDERMRVAIFKFREEQQPPYQHSHQQPSQQQRPSRQQSGDLNNKLPPAVVPKLSQPRNRPCEEHKRRHERCPDTCPNNPKQLQRNNGSVTPQTNRSFTPQMNGPVMQPVNGSGMLQNNGSATPQTNGPLTQHNTWPVMQQPTATHSQGPQSNGILPPSRGFSVPTPTGLSGPYSQMGSPIEQVSSAPAQIGTGSVTSPVSEEWYESMTGNIFQSSTMAMPSGAGNTNLGAVDTSNWAATQAFMMSGTPQQQMQQTAFVMPNQQSWNYLANQTMLPSNAPPFPISSTPSWTGQQFGQGQQQVYIPSTNSVNPTYGAIDPSASQSRGLDLSGSAASSTAHVHHGRLVRWLGRMLSRNSACAKTS